MTSNNYARRYRRCCAAGVAVAAIAACGPRADTATPVGQNPPPSRHEATPQMHTGTLLSAVPAECRGADLDLLAIARLPVCKVTDTPEPLPRGVSLSLDADAITAAPGFKATANLVLRNDTDAAMALVIDATCDYLNVYDSQILDADGARADRVGRTCERSEAQGCAGKVVRIALEPGGAAKLPYEVRAEIEVSNATCTGIGKRELPVGTYDLVIATSLREEPVKAKLKVRGNGR